MTLDDLVKGDVEEMKCKIEVNEMNKWTYVIVVFQLLMVLSSGVVWAVFDVIRWWSMIVPFSLWLISMYAAMKIEKIKKDKDIQTYREIRTYMDEDSVEVAHDKKYKKKDSQQKVMIVIVFTIVATVVAGLSLFIATQFL